jgi:hypothetical protein
VGGEKLFVATVHRALGLCEDDAAEGETDGASDCATDRAADGNALACVPPPQPARTGMSATIVMLARRRLR